VDWKGRPAFQKPDPVRRFNKAVHLRHLRGKAIDPGKQGGREAPSPAEKSPRPAEGRRCAEWGKGEKTITLFTPPGTNEAFDDGNRPPITRG